MLRNLSLLLTILIFSWGCTSNVVKANKILPDTKTVIEIIPPPENQFNLKGFYLGMSEEYAKETDYVKCSDADKKIGCLDRLCLHAGNPTIADAECDSLALGFSNDKLLYISASFPSNKYEQIVRSFTLKYGKPTKISTDKVNTLLSNRNIE